MIDINYEYYRVFYYVAKLGSITKAAEYLGNNQPNITRMIHRMEEQLECRLLQRNPRGVSLTTEGKILFSHVEIAVEHIMDGEKELMDRKEFRAGRISIGCTEMALNLFLLDKLSVFHESYPGVQIHITNHSTPQAMKALKDGKVDCAVVSTPFLNDPSIDSRTLTSFQEILVGGKMYHDYTKEPHFLKELKEIPLIMLRDKTATRTWYRDLYFHYNEEMIPEIEVATADQILPLILKNLGIGYLPEVLCTKYLEEESIYRIPIIEQIPKREIALLTRKNSLGNTIIEEFIRIL